jgi:hypothetical protein
MAQRPIIPPTPGCCGEWFMRIRSVLLAIALSGTITTANAVQAASAVGGGNATDAAN